MSGHLSHADPGSGSLQPEGVGTPAGFVRVWPWIAGAVVVAVVIALPHLLGSYAMNLVVQILLFAALATAWNILGGFAGEHSLGHALFLGIGAYTSTLLFVQWDITPWLGMLVGAALAAAAGILIAYISFRQGVTGPYFALITIALAEGAGQIVVNTPALGGATGLTVPLREPSVAIMQFSSAAGYYYLAAALTALSVLVCYWLLQSRLGYQIMAARENEAGAQALGVNTLKVKVIATALSAALTAMGGTLWAQYYMYIDPTSVFGEAPSVSILLFAVIGGLGTLLGPLLGAVLLVPLAEYTKTLIGSQVAGIDVLMYGTALILITLFVRERRGLIDLLALLVRRLGRRNP